MKSFGKQPGKLLVAGALAVAMSACQQAKAETNNGMPRPEPGNSWMELIGKISKAIRGGFGHAARWAATDAREDDDEGYGATGG